VETFPNQTFCGQRTDASVTGPFPSRLLLKMQGLPRLPEWNVDWQGPILGFSMPLSVSNPQIFPQAAMPA
jgi:hypothetical protein